MRRLFSITFVVLVIIVGVLKVAEWTSENWWMSSLGFGGAQTLFWKWRLGAFVPAFGLWWLVMGGNARLAWHNARWRDVSLPLLGPREGSGRGHSPEDRVRLDALALRGSQAFVLLGALLCGVASANHFDLWVLARHPPAFGGADNASFLVGVWPALLWAWNAFGALLGFTLAVVAAIAVYEGVLDFDSRGFRVGDATARHLAACGALLLLWIGVRCGLSAGGEAVNFGWSPNGVSGFYERSFATPTRTFFLLSSPFLALWFGRAAPRRPLRPLIAALGWSFGALFLPLIAPSFGRAVRANSPSLEQTLRDENARHIAATRRAWGLSDVEERDLKVAASDFSVPVSSTEGGSASPTEVVAWPHEALRRALAQNDEGNSLGRVPGALYLSRERNTLRADVISSNPVVKEATSSLTIQSDPSRPGALAARTRPFEAVVMQSPFAPELASPRAAPLAEGESLSSPARVRETDSSGGVVRENGFMGASLAVRFGNSSFLTAGPAITWHLDPLERVRTLAPFVWWTGARPHPVWMSVPGSSSERLFWLVEGCFVSGSMPSSAMLPAGDEWSGLSYARQSVLGVCDATTGETSFYLFDPTEPFSRVWNELLPGFFKPTSELPAPIRHATRLSPALLNAQNFVWTRYHRALPGRDETLDWSKRSDEWRALSLDTSQRNALAHPTLVKRGEKVGLEQLAAFAPWGGTLSSNNTSAPTGTALVALLSARDEGEDIWREGGKARFSSWRSANPITLPLSDEATTPPVVSSFALELFDKRALFLALDERGDCTGLGISHGQAKRVKSGRELGKWFLETKVASTKLQLAPPSSPSEAGENLKRARNLWSAWKTARARGQWARVEELERALNQLLTP